MDTLDNRLQKRINVSLYALLFLTVLLGISVLLEGCTNTCETTNSYVYYEPVYSTLAEIRAQVSQDAPHPIASVGKIYYKEGYLFVSEPGEGIHIIDNRNPSSPVAKSFLKVPGAFDMAIKNNTLYADSYVDLVAFDITDVNAIREVSRIEGIFRNFYQMGYQVDPNCCVITSWEQKNSVTVADSDCTFNGQIQPWGGIFYNSGIAFEATAAMDLSSKAAIAPGNGSGPGVGGSLARFTISNEHLYMLDAGQIVTVDVHTEQQPSEASRTDVGWDMETIFPYKDKLFIGASTGMYILDISQATHPSLISQYQHVTSCDPVVVDDQYAYVTLRTGNICAQGVNQLEIIDIQNPASPTMLVAYPMTNPHGLGIDDKTLFVCDGTDGLKAFDASDIYGLKTNMLAHYSDISATDVIPYNDLLMMIGEEGIYQYDYTDPANIRLLSQIQIVSQ